MQPAVGLGDQGARADISVFEVPRRHVKGRKRSCVVVCNSVAQSVVESVRGQHEEFVSVYAGSG